MSERTNGYIMLKDTPVAQVINSDVKPIDIEKMPLYLAKGGLFEEWLSQRAVDSTRVNSRLLKKALGVRDVSDVSTVLKCYAAKLTDNYWFKPINSDLSYSDISKWDDSYFKLALKGDSNCFIERHSNSPELTNTGSYEKGWKYIDGEWWLYKRGSETEIFSELFVSKIGTSLGFDMAYYEAADDSIRTRNFCDGLNSEPIAALIGDNEDELVRFNALEEYGDEVLSQFLRILWLDVLCFNMDRHNYNIELLRDDSGNIVRLAPNFDNNVALISRGYRDLSLENSLMKWFVDLLDKSQKARELFDKLVIPEVTEDIIKECCLSINIKEVDIDWVVKFVMKNYTALSELKGSI